MTKALTKRLILVVNQKGGVGKSVVTKSLIDNYRSAKIKVHAFDADGSVGSLLATYGTRTDGRLDPEQDSSVGVGYYDIRSDNSRNYLLDCLEIGGDIIVHDLAGGSLSELSRIVDDGDGVEGLISAIEGQGYQIVLCHVISNVQGSTASVRDYMNAFGEHAQHVAVINKAWGKEDKDFPFWFGYEKPDGSKVAGKTRTTLLEGGGSEIHFPALQAGTFAKVEAANMKYADAEHSSDLTITERAHMSKFNKAAREAFLAAKEKLGL